MTWDVAVLPASMDAVLMVNRSCCSALQCARKKLCISLQATAQQMETTSWGAETRSFPKHHQRFPSTTKTAHHLLLNPPGVWIAQGAWPRERLCGEVGFWYGVWRLQQVLVGRNGKHHWTVSDRMSHQNASWKNRWLILTSSLETLWQNPKEFWILIKVSNLNFFWLPPKVTNVPMVECWKLHFRLLAS